MNNEICHECGMKYGEPRNRLATYHYGHCDWCDKDDVAVTEPRDYGSPELPKKESKP